MAKPIPMHAVLPFPDISPEVFSITLGSSTFALRWYALAYIVGILIGWQIALKAVKTTRIWRDQPPLRPSQVEDLLTWIILGVIIGGRLGYVLFYDPARFLANPKEIPMVWAGGMSFHGGFLGVVVAVLLFTRRNGIPLGSTADILAISVAPGLFLGRIANFINAELWGKPTDLPWGVIFPGIAAQDCPGVSGLCARHPSQLYEAALEGLVLGAILLYLAFRKGWLKTPWRLTGLFFAGYGLSRFIVEFFRQADEQFRSPDNPTGYAMQLGEAGLTMGQLLSLPMLIIGIMLMVWSRRTHPPA